MSVSETIAKLRRDRGLTQEQLAARLYVTRQAVSRWETGKTEPGIDMRKLLAFVLDAPLALLLDFPQEPACQSCGAPFSVPEMPFGTDANGQENPDYCKWCYDNGAFTSASLDDLIERNVPFLTEATGMTADEAVSFMGAMLPNLKRWRAVQTNERLYGAEARERYGDEVIDAANEKVLAMGANEWNSLGELEQAIKQRLAVLVPAGDPKGSEARELCAMHAAWIKGHWPEGAYTPEAHLGLARGYLCDERFTEYYDGAAGEGATKFLVAALEEHLG